MQFPFNAAQVEPSSGSLPPIPAGWYPARCMESDLKDTSDKQGKFLAFTFEIIDGQYKGRKIYARLNIQNANPSTVEFAYKDLSAFCHAVQVMQMQDTQQLHNIPLQIKVKMRAAEGSYEASNDVSGYRHITDAATGGMPAATAPAAGAGPAVPWAGQQQAPAQQAPAAAAAPWGNQAPAQAPAPQQQAAPQAQAPAPAAQPWQQPAQQQQAPANTAPPAGAAPWQQAQAPAPAAAAPQQPPQQPQQQAAPAATGAPPWAGGAAAGAPPWAQPQQ